MDSIFWKDIACFHTPYTQNKKPTKQHITVCQKQSAGGRSPISWRWMWKPPSSRRCLPLWILQRTIGTWKSPRKLPWPRGVRWSSGWMTKNVSANSRNLNATLKTQASRSKVYSKVKNLKGPRPSNQNILCTTIWWTSPRMRWQWLVTIGFAYEDCFAST